jgi:hypothetical protein
MEARAQPAGIEELVDEVRRLRERLERVERLIAGGTAPLAEVSATPEALPGAPPTLTAAPLVRLESTASSLPILGRALLGLAGAYLLRALTEAGALPAGLGVGMGIAYALLWLVLAARAPAGDRFVVAVHAFTASLVLAPLLWEAATRLRVVSSGVAAALLAFFCVFGLAISWRKNLTDVAWITTLTSLGTCIALMLSLRDLPAFLLALLVIAAAVESAAFRDHWLGERWIVALSVDVCLLMLVLIAGRTGGLPESYVPFSFTTTLTLLALLLLVYLGGAVARTLVRGLEITVFETLQTVCAFVIALWGALRVAAGNPRAAAVVGIMALAAAALCYLVSYALVERRQMPRRNLYTYTSFAFLLVLTGSRLVLDGTALGLLWSALALLCLWGGLRSGRRTLLLQSSAYLGAASVVSGALAQASLGLLGGGAVAGSPAAGAAVVTVAALAGAALLLSAGPGEETVARGMAWAVFLGLAGWSGAGMLVWLLSPFTAGGAAGTGLSATLATGLLSGLSLLLAWIGRRCGRREIVWLVVPLLAVTTYKLVTRDLSTGQTWTVVLSLVSFGAVLVVLPRFLQKQPAGDSLSQ